MKAINNYFDTPTLESVSLTLTPREAFLLTMLIGNVTPSGAIAFINLSSESTDKRYSEYPSFDAPKSVIGRCSETEARDITSHTYNELTRVLSQAYNKGVK